MDSSKVIKVIRKIVREEVRKAVKPLLNEILAEQFVKILAQNNNQNSNQKSLSLTNTVLQETSDYDGPTLEQRNTKRQAFLQEERRRRFQELTAGDPMQELIYGDLNPEEVEAVSTISNAPEGAYVDTPDEGVDLSRFGF